MPEIVKQPHTSTEQVKQWLNHDLLLLAGGAEIVNGQLDPTVVQKEHMAAEMKASLEAKQQRHIEILGDLAVKHAGPDTEEALLQRDVAEKSQMKERIDHWLDTGVIKLTTWLGRNRIAREYNPRQYSNAFTDLQNKPGAALIKARRMPFAKELLAMGVSEVVTVSNPQQKFGRFDRKSPQADEDAVQIDYKTLTGETAKGSPYKYRSKVVSGNSLSVGIVLPKTEADQFVQAVHDDPQVMRELVEALMAERFDAGESWENARPSYEDWRNVNEGVNRIAFRPTPTTYPAQSEALTF
ncbi:MAG TPA: hypothetical protein VN778_03240 [Verrucomicrobiae bacterium]|nr:hypothetical protein [Verrucomicrobiae bacterium]